MKLRSWLFRVALIYCGTVLLLFSIVEWTDMNDRVNLLALVPPSRRLNVSGAKKLLRPAALSQKLFGSKNSSWVRVSHSVIQVFVFTAYLDMRTSDFHLAKTPAVRLPIIMESMYRKQWLLRPSMFQCYFPSLNVSVVAHLYEQCENHDQRFGAYIVNCLVSPNWTEQLTSVQLRPSKSGKYKANHEVVISKILSANKKAALNVTVCVHSPIFGHIYSPDYIIRYVQLTRLLGADHFIFFIAGSAERSFENLKLLRVLHKFQADGLATVIDFSLPIERHAGIWYHGQSSAVQECIFRSIGDTQYLVLSDLDEFIVPVAPITWNELFAQLWANRSSATGFRMQPLYFHSTPWRKRLKTNEFAPFVRFETKGSESHSSLTKCVVRPERVFEMGIHHISKQFQEYFTNEELKKSVALLYHYTHKDLANLADQRVSTNTAMLRYKNNFDKGVNKMLHKYLK